MTMRKRLIKFKWLIIIGLSVLTPLAWYHGFIPIASGKARSGIRHALDLRTLPSSMRINSSGSESWADYILEADCSISPIDFNSLLSGRDYEQDSVLYAGDRFTNAVRIKDYEGFAVDTMWTWTYKSPDMDILAECKLYTNKARDRVYIRFISD